MLHVLLNPGFIAITSLFLSVVWMMRDQNDKTRPLLVIALVVNLFYGVILSTVMAKENGLVPWKYDYVLANLDRALGFTGSRIALGLQGAMRQLLAAVYQLMIPMMVAWFLVAKARRGSGSIIIAYITEMVTGPIFYALVPACGPAYAFHSKWLMPPVVAPQLVRFDGMPNAFPSLHVATALVFLFYAPTAKWRGIALLFLAGTIGATLSTGEHYVIDLVVGLAFGCFAANIGRRNVMRSATFLALMLVWTASVRFAHLFLIAHAALLQVLAAATVAATVVAIAIEWRDNRIAAPVATPARVSDGL